MQELAFLNVAESKGKCILYQVKQNETIFLDISIPVLNSFWTRKPYMTLFYAPLWWSTSKLFCVRSHFPPSTQLLQNELWKPLTRASCSNFPFSPAALVMLESGQSKLVLHHKANSFLATILLVVYCYWNLMLSTVWPLFGGCHFKRVFFFKFPPARAPPSSFQYGRRPFSPTPPHWVN